MRKWQTQKFFGSWIATSPSKRVTIVIARHQWYRCWLFGVDITQMGWALVCGPAAVRFTYRQWRR